ncbi:MAG: FHA domain-containing protein [Gammaproteobacteria bacterium]|jgi:hypothetical protein
MEALIIQHSKRPGRLSEFVKSTGTSLTLGRGFNNDVILSDHFIAAQQLRFDYEDGAWRLKVLDNTNPVLINNKPVTEDGVVISSGDELTVGRTQLVLLTSDHPVERTRKLILSNWMSRHGPRIALPIMAVVISALLAVFSDYLQATGKIRWEQQLAGGLLYAFVVTLWAGGWALAGRLLHHKPNFFPQLFAIAVILAGFTIASLFTGYVEYATASSSFGNLVEMGFLLFIITLMLKYNLTFATELKRRGLVSFSVVALLMLFVVVLNQLEQREFNSWPEYSEVVKPPFAKWTSDESLDTFFSEVDRQFTKLQKQMKK